MRDSGLRMVFMGAESGSDETLIRMNKGGSASTEKTLHMAEKARRYGIVPEFSFVMGNPPDPEADVHSTLAFIRKVKKVNPHTEIIMYVYTPVPLAGELYDQAKAEGFLVSRNARGMDRRRLAGFFTAPQRVDSRGWPIRSTTTCATSSAC